MGRGLRALQSFSIVDLSLPISPFTPEPDPPHIDYINHARSARELATICTDLFRQASAGGTSTTVITEEAFVDGLGLANENLRLDPHSGTHLDAPWHFGPLCENKPAKTIDQIPLEWCFGPGVVLDLRHKKSGDLIMPSDLQQALARIDYVLQPRDIVLIMTGADKHFEQADYFDAHPGMGREATLWLIDQGVKVMGLDGWGFDRPVNAMLEDHVSSGGEYRLLPAHMVGREREYCHLEKLGNLDKIPVPHGFWVCCFPVKIEKASAGWVRAVALVPGESQ